MNTRSRKRWEQKKDEDISTTVEQLHLENKDESDKESTHMLSGLPLTMEIMLKQIIEAQEKIHRMNLKDWRKIGTSGNWKEKRRTSRNARSKRKRGTEPTRSLGKRGIGTERSRDERG